MGTKNIPLGISQRYRLVLFFKECTNDFCYYCFMFKQMTACVCWHLVLLIIVEIAVVCWVAGRLIKVVVGGIHHQVSRAFGVSPGGCRGAWRQ